MPVTREIIFYGIDATGKTSIIRSLTDNHFITTYYPTQSTNHVDFVLNSTRFRYFDTAGQAISDMDSNIQLLDKKGRIAIVVFSNDRFISYKGAVKFVNKIRNFNPDTKIILCCNHSDINRHRKIPTNQIIEQTIGLSVVQVSSRLNTGFEVLIDEMKN